MTNLVCDFMNSYWSSEEMNLTTPQSLLTHDLKVRSSGSPGRCLLQRLEDCSLNLLGATEALEFAQLLQVSEPESRQVLEELLEWTFLDDEFLLVALVALAPELGHVAERLCRFRPSEDTIAEVLAQATVALRQTYDLAEGERIDFVLREASRKTRAHQRMFARHNVPAVKIPWDYDEAEPEVELRDMSEVVLSLAVDSHVITLGESSLIEATRSGRRSLEQLARESGDSYNALRMRRARAEDRLRRFYGVIEVAK